MLLDLKTHGSNRWVFIKTGLCEYDSTLRKWHTSGSEEWSQFTCHFFHDMEAVILEPEIVRKPWLVIRVNVSLVTTLTNK